MHSAYKIIAISILYMHAVEATIQICPNGYRNTGGRQNPTCAPCGPGFADNKNSQNTCDKCGPGFYSDKEANVACYTCGPGSYSKDDSNTLCSACEVNTFSNSFFSACVDCPVGQIKNASGACDKCFAGTYSDVTGRKCIAVSPGIKTSPSNFIGCMILQATVNFLAFY